MQIPWFFKAINKYIADHKKLAGALVICLVFDAAFDTLMRGSLKFIIDAAIIPQNYRLLVLILCLLGLGGILYACVGLLGNFLGARLGVLIINKIRYSLFEHLQTLSMDFFGRRSAGDIVNCVLADVAKVENGVVTMGLSVLIIDLSNILFSAIFLFSLNWQLAVLSFIGFSFCAIAPTKIAAIATEKGYDLRQKEGHIATVVEENILSQSVVKIFGLEKHMIQDFTADLKNFKQVYIRATFLSYLVQKIPVIVFVFVQIIILSIGAAMVYRNFISVGTLVSYQVLLIGLNNSIFSLTFMVPYIIEAVAAMRRINDILTEVPQVKDQEGSAVLPHFSRAVHFKDVNFSYTSEREGIKNLSLTICPKEFIVFVGPSGAGKSTIVNLLARFYDPDKGCILFDGVDLRQAQVRSLRSQIGLVSQEVILFNTTVRENIRMGYLDASNEQVEAAAKAAEIHDFILTLPQGYDTQIGDRGGQLSGGQRQRIALARALVRDPAILILDEATSALDPATEAGILATIEHIAKERTVIMITHRIAQALRANRIFVLENGQIVASGRHADLLEQKGLYATLWQQSHPANTNLTVQANS
ncbi:ABC transporter [Planktothricoides sp. SR001]|uniref:ABC transporter ATP-binding protein n=1 Tax=Planktothricoides sp. SR001 TaxID=1705388 RepID=UPI0006C039BF|nr:ABC transporter ATP-binding protein [Planktothricoides sp. SR001]KOR37387.1 ABC transporter [Planktothricoides sp. SR001]